MAIGTDARIRFYGTRDSLDDGTTSAVTSGSYSVAADISAWTNDDDAERAVIDVALTYGTAPTAGDSVKFYMRKLNINSTNDEPTPDDDNQGSYVGAVTIDSGTSAQYFAIEVDLVSQYTSQQYEFYLKNGADQTLSANWTADITPIAPGPHA